MFRTLERTRSQVVDKRVLESEVVVRGIPSLGLLETWLKLEAKDVNQGGSKDIASGCCEEGKDTAQQQQVPSSHHHWKLFKIDKF
jgi:hypothetical protein